ncbi:sn-glycerol-3-phosphate ABC transporter ATP-binding protein UgpC [Devosia sp. PTR5]|uniref:Sn-glycerol-3-phosphate ABC transporter ATP-binding protein UgpC n=1 Tax=Devosia oryzisoli TaxID=2774138 RepID=A0A927FWJ4_9HYPH|nr:sn-glycerol-3-phosphate ABC transporter ATP-binding protein UgpC [Devosia oryzisoli]MBD8066612.1 sn-glycerol-3-phosphate ABC transporter ATP-binding protein UgpC [Devosia oryzisoli]
MVGMALRNVRKSFGGLEVIHGVNLEVPSGELVVFVGPSGCGKSTLLRMIAGLEDISGGDVLIGGQMVNEVPPSGRGIAMVFQSYALYPHMSVYDNIAFGLRNIRTPEPEVARRVSEAARILQLEPLLQRLPRALSGGQRQRVAIGRAIVREPKVFLFDEPLSNLDAALRAQTRIEIARLHQTLGATMIYVTHDQIEAMTLADRVVVLNGGRIEQVGTPLDLYDRPDNVFVAGFIGSPRMNFLPAAALAGGVGADASLVGIRPEHLKPARLEEATLGGTVEIVEQLGEHMLAYVRVGDQLVVVKTDRQHEITLAQELPMTFEARHIHRFDSTGRAIR